MVLKKWRQRRASIRELKANPDELYKEYLKLCAQDKQLPVDIDGKSEWRLQARDVDGGKEERANGDGL
jgi:hypothetical protein